ncbi:Fe-S oxidoreductase [Desulfitobacterium dichloroeliminans LMG P-21439]|uniref:Fe-S oxidoreductase n=1 Tax=Desulfitobacterium dichloroeliminans (strain LMG P-21439 / DCA1) TaxID=871963 RepID=L0F4K9_DESDL|nr:radical SAM protein [Desulfitobacterium dichloroeliminans]AGA67591.1 Fe-S oxidoreductase [Desulfitobacterium dichloroeliminans LMG P-21439]
MRIMLIQPKMNKRPMDTDLKTRMSPSLALLTLVSLTPECHEVIMVNENMEEIQYPMDIELVGITITLDVMPRAVEIAQRFRRLGIPVVAGGIHITSSPEECLQHFDAICIGAAERVWAGMIEDVEQGRLQQIYHDMSDFRGEEIVSPAYHKIDKSRYLYTNVILTSRGCPNRCDFCYNSCQNKIYARRPLEDVIKDIESLGTRHVLFIDDNFIGAPAYTRELLNNLRGMNLKWSAAVTTKIADHLDLLDLMAETGCQSLFIGFESINNSSLHGVNKDNHFEKYERLAAEIHRRGIMINASMVFGLDGDERDVFARTLEWLVKNKIETLTSHILTPYPGTELYRRIKREGRIIDHELAKYNTAHVVFQPKGMSAAELYEGYLWIYREFYTLRNIVSRMPHHKAQRKSYFLFNLLYRKFGRVTALLARVIPMRLVGRLAAQISYKIK